MSISAIKHLKEILKGEKLTHFEVIPLNQPLSFPQYEDWLAANKQGEMAYMASHQEVRKTPQQHFKPMKSMIVFTEDYFPHPQASDMSFQQLKIAHYARNKDYHFWFKEKLNDRIKVLKQSFPNEEFRAFTDAVPLLERDYGAQAHLGWVGKNTCLIHPKKGSLFFIGEILTSLTCEESPALMHDFCGKCRACIDACPTDALDESRSLDANRCLAYWNIESRKTPPIEIREKMNGWFFGCDICQTVCPWNIKWHGLEVGFSQEVGSREGVTKELQWVLQSSNKQLMKELKETPLSRAGGRGLKRNALIVIANLQLTELLADVQRFQDHETLAELAQWTIMKLQKSHDMTSR